MKNLLGLGVFGTFGKPYGFQQYFYFDTVFNQTLDLNTNAIEIFPSTELFSIKREIYNGLNSICISKYSYANEINSSRGGTFIGSCILLNEAYTSSENIYQLLTELHNDLISSEKNLINSTLQVQQAHQLEVKEPVHFESVKTQLKFLKETEFYSNSVNQSKKFLIVPKTNEDKETQLKTFIENSIQYFNDVDTLYFTFDEKAINYVSQKGLLKLINWQTFIDRKEEVIKERAELRRIEEERKRQEAKNVSSKGSNQKTGFEYWDDKSLKWGKDKGQVKKRIEEHNRLLDYCFELDSQKSPQVRQIIQNPYHSHRHHSHREESYFEQNKTIIFLVLNLLFIVFVTLYLFFFNEPEVKYIYNSPEVTEQTEKQENKLDTPESKELEPKPNSELNDNDRKRVEKIGLKGRNGKDIIQSIFQKNPTDIKSHYEKQVNQYLEYLISKNPDCFSKESDICSCDSLAHIPSFKKDK